MDSYLHFFDLTLEKSRSLFIQLTRKQMVEKLHHFDFRASRFYGPGRFQAQESPSDNRDSPVALGVVNKFEGIIQRSQSEYALLLRSLDGWDKSQRAAGQDEKLIFLLLSSDNLDLFGIR